VAVTITNFGAMVKGSGSEPYLTT